MSAERLQPLNYVTAIDLSLRKQFHISSGGSTRTVRGEGMQKSDSKHENGRRSGRQGSGVVQDEGNGPTATREVAFNFTDDGESLRTSSLPPIQSESPSLTVQTTALPRKTSYRNDHTFRSSKHRVKPARFLRPDCAQASCVSHVNEPAGSGPHIIPSTAIQNSTVIR